MARRALSRLWSLYEAQLAATPVRTQMATSCVLWAVGDCVAQRVEWYEAATYGGSTEAAGSAAAGVEQHKHQQQHQQHFQQHLQQHQQDDQQQQQLDLRRVALTAAFGAGFIGPVGHVWYETIEKACRRLVPGGGPRFLATKVALDSAIMGSVYVVAFFAFIAAALERSGLAGFQHKMAVDFWPTYAAELALWPAVQTVNFSKVPVRHQLLVVNGFSLLDAAFISYVGHSEDWSGKLLARLGWGGGASSSSSVGAAAAEAAGGKSRGEGK